MDLKRGEEVIESKKTILCSTGFSDPILICFDHPVQGMAEVGVVIENELTTDEEKAEVVNFYFAPSTDSKNGTGVQGGQIPLIVFYA
ncbi:unnamed protein product [Gongylonema pulchrum]|uniref:PHR domain-containing protein n=1 Tax=Gongylonema pulchrum TaxID=637853 RepID=A0A183DTF5_9BILA|nr:unnamed protein product [Gongylonema pulchrum]